MPSNDFMRFLALKPHHALYPLTLTMLPSPTSSLPEEREEVIYHKLAHMKWVGPAWDFSGAYNKTCKQGIFLRGKRNFSKGYVCIHVALKKYVF